MPENQLESRGEGRRWVALAAAEDWRVLLRTRENRADGNGCAHGQREVASNLGGSVDERERDRSYKGQSEQAEQLPDHYEHED